MRNLVGAHILGRLGKRIGLRKPPLLDPHLTYLNRRERYIHDRFGQPSRGAACTLGGGTLVGYAGGDTRGLLCTCPPGFCPVTDTWGNSEEKAYLLINLFYCKESCIENLVHGQQSTWLSCVHRPLCSETGSWWVVRTILKCLSSPADLELASASVSWG